MIALKVNNRTANFAKKAGQEGARDGERGTKGDGEDGEDVTFFGEESNKEPVCDVKGN